MIKHANKNGMILFIVLFFLIGDLKAQLATVPFQLKENHLYIRLGVNRSDSLLFMFDSGATGIIIDSTVATKAIVDKENLQKVSVGGMGSFKSDMTFMAINQNLKLNHVMINGISLTAMNLGPISADLGIHIDGIVGYDILSKYITQIDFDHKKLFLYDQIKSLDTTGYTGIPFEFSKNMNIPRFPISITLKNNESFKGKVMFDTGSPFSLLVSSSFSTFHGLIHKLEDTNTAPGMNPNADDVLANIKSMSIAGFNFKEMGIRVTVGNGGSGSDGYLGNIGVEIIRHFNVIFDYYHKRIYLKPNKFYREQFPLIKSKAAFAKESLAFLEKNKKKAGIQLTPSGLQYMIIKKGNGPKPHLEDVVKVEYKITLFNGEKVWNTYEDKKPWINKVNSAFNGLKEALLMMPVGSRWTLTVPPSLAFGDTGYGQIPSSATLNCEVELVSLISM